MIFNKNNKGNEELRTLTGSYYKSNEFDKVKVKVMLSSEELAEFIGEAVYDLANTHYNSDNYQAPDPEPEADGSTSGSGSGGTGIPARPYSLLDQLVEHMQLPIAFQATMWHYQGNDLSHEDSGRKNKIDSNSEKIAWEWQYDRDDAVALRNYHKALNRLIKFLNKHLKDFPEWEDSPARKLTLTLFIYTAEHFNRLFPIDQSEAFFLKISPLMREIERKHIKPILGADKFNALKAAIQSPEGIGEEDLELYEYICDPIPLMTMSKAVKRFFLTVIPEGVVQNFVSERNSREASIPATLNQVNAVSKVLWADGIDVLNELKKFWGSQVADETDQSIDEFLPGGTVDDKFSSL